MAKFKTGDEVRIIKRIKGNQTGPPPECYAPDAFVGAIGIVSSVALGNISSYTVCRSGDEGYCGIYRDGEIELVSSKPTTAKWTDTTPHTDSLVTLSDGERRATIFHDKGKFLRCDYDMAKPPIRIPESMYTKEDWAFLEKVARKVRSFKN